MALIMRLFGAGLLQGRLVMVVFSMLALVLAARLATVLFGRWAGPLAWWMVLSCSWPFFLLIARMILGETPALALLLAALLCWYAYLDHRRWPALALAGLGMGMAMAAKPQMLLLVPAFGLLGLLDMLYYRQLRLRHYLILGSLALVVLLVCYAYQVVNVGWDMYIRDTASASASAGYYFNFDPTTFWLRTGLGLNERTLLFLLILAALAWHVRRLRSRTIASLKLAAPVIFCAVWVAWHTLLATNARYALIGYAIGMILVSGMLIELLPVLWAQMHPTTRRLGLGCVVLLLALPLVLQIQFLQAEMRSGLDEMVAYIRAELPANARIETLDWGIDVFIDRSVGHMPLSVHYAVLEAFNYIDQERRLAEVQYDFRPNHPDYILIGPASENVPTYTRAAARGDIELVARFEDYALYRVSPAQGEPATISTGGS
jgi:hypothetical protein